MNISGIITEYNPFHNGHLYHLQKVKERCENNAIICIMNGNFVQRGQPALLDKWARTRMAIENGVDLVIELPLVYGIRSAEYFALGAVQLLNATGVVDSLVFGSELGRIEPLKILAGILNEEKPYFQKRLRTYLNNGFPYPVAREKALHDYINRNPERFRLDDDEIERAMAQPNNILGIEYIKAIYQLNSRIKPVTIKRIKSDYHSRELSGEIASATAIRERIDSGTNKLTTLPDLKKFMPEASWRILKEEFQEGKAPVRENYLGIIILAKLRQMKTSELKEFAEIDNGLENRIMEAAHHTGTFYQLVDQIKTKAFTWTRIQRNLLHILFGLDAAEFRLLDENGPQYLRVLGFNKRGEKILARIMEKSSLPVIIQPADFLNSIDLKNKDPLIKSLSYDILASDLYSLLYPAPEKRVGHQDFTTPLITY
ncbi:MAG: hypothetical protein PWR10_128 [Halanaerobiales bacterium]|nr:hypothetical protein [Halanaerobiales bacterium]